jgi:hypothetical protein
MTDVVQTPGSTDDADSAALHERSRTGLSVDALWRGIVDHCVTRSAAPRRPCDRSTTTGHSR